MRQDTRDFRADELHKDKILADIRRDTNAPVVNVDDVKRDLRRLEAIQRDLTWDQRERFRDWIYLGHDGRDLRHDVTDLLHDLQATNERPRLP